MGGRSSQAPRGELVAGALSLVILLGEFQPAVQLGIKAAARAHPSTPNWFISNFPFHSDILGFFMLNSDHKEPYLLAYEMMIK